MTILEAFKQLRDDLMAWVRNNLVLKVDKEEGKGLSTNDFTTDERTKLSGIESGAQVNTITGIKGDSESSYRTGDINISAANIGLGNVDNTSDSDKPISTAQQQALDAKQATVTGGASTITSSNLTTNRALVSNGSGKVVVSTVTSTELGYLDGVTSNVQTQLDNKTPVTRTINEKALTEDITLSASDIGALNDYNPIGVGSFSMNRKSETDTGYFSHAIGYHTIAEESYSNAQGYCTIAKKYQHTFGKYNQTTDGAAGTEAQDTTNSDALFIIGCGISSLGKNAFRVSSGGKCFGSEAFGASGADFAELFEWADGNPNNEDRRGLFVTLEGEKIRIANADDDYIGVISGAQAFIGNSASEEWQGKYLTDIFGTKLLQEVEVSEEVDEITGKVIIPASTTTQYVINPDYDPNKEYIMRENRKEWGIVGLLGQIVMIDDGTCVVGSYVKPSINGIGTASNNGYRVMKRIDENHIKVLVK